MYFIVNGSSAPVNVAAESVHRALWSWRRASAIGCWWFARARARRKSKPVKIRFYRYKENCSFNNNCERVLVSAETYYYSFFFFFIANEKKMYTDIGWEKRANEWWYKKWFRFSGKVWTALGKVTIVVIRSRLLSLPALTFIVVFYHRFTADKQYKLFRVSWKKCQGKLSFAARVSFLPAFVLAYMVVVKNRLRANAN